jgi:serine-type D-Ala-D-Ala carboxypeptidase/endopeptidase (penicillin-binding protein 4)
MSDDELPRPRGRRRLLPAAVAVLLIATSAVVGSVVLYRSTSDEAANPSPSPGSVAAPSPLAPPTTSATPPPSAAPVPALWQRTLPSAAPLMSAHVPLPGGAEAATPAGLLAKLGPLVADPALAGDAVATVVADAATGQLLFDHLGADVEVPASTAKLAVAVAALQVLGPDDRLKTRVVAGPSPGAIVLVGGGDPTLAGPAAIGPFSPGYPAPASLTDLATQTAAQLHAQGITSVSLGYDASLFGGPQMAVGWKPLYYTEGDVAPVTALEVDEGRADLAKPARSADPAGVAAQQFAALLTAHGLTVGDPESVRARAGAPTIASVLSPPVSALVQRMLGRSDNDLAEALSRRVALAVGGQPTFAGGVRAVKSALLGLGVTGFAMVDASGLSPSDRVTPTALVQVLRLVVAPGHPQLAAILDGLPVAGFSGTLGARFTGSAAAGAGVVRAKTGTLNGVAALAGYLVDTAGDTLVFAALANGVKPTAAAITDAALDRIAAGLASCGCPR